MNETGEYREFVWNRRIKSRRCDPESQPGGLDAFTPSRSAGRHLSSRESIPAAHRKVSNAFSTDDVTSLVK